MGREDFKPLENDVSRYPEIRAHLEQTFRRKTRDDWFAELRPLDIGVAPVYALDEAVADPHHQARGMTVELEPEFGAVQQVGVGPKLSATPGRVRSTSPLRGEHTDAELAALGTQKRRSWRCAARGPSPESPRRLGWLAVVPP